MTAPERCARLLGADYRQWRALTRVMLTVNWRTAPAMQFGEQRQRDGYGGMFVLMYGIFGSVAAMLAAFLPGVFMAATGALSFVMLVLAISLLTGFQTVLTSRTDLDVLGYQPVSPRTIFLARLTNLLVYGYAMGALLAAPAIITMLVRFGFLGAIGWLAAAALAVAWMVLLVATSYTALVRIIPADRLRSGLGYIQLAGSTLAPALIIAPMLLQRFDLFERFGTEPMPVLLLFPPAWFAGLPRLATGSLTLLDLGLSAAALGSSAALLLIARGRLALAFTDSIIALQASAPAPRRRRRTWWRRASAELRVMMLLIRAQFRHEMRFRLAVLGAFPMGLIMLGLPFLYRSDGQAETDSFLVLGLPHMMTIMLPVTLQESLRSSESYRAAWVFFSAPTDLAKLTVSAVNCAGLCFLLPYVFMVGAVLCWLLGDIVRGIGHTLLLGVAAYAAMQLALRISPWIPFSEPPPKQATGRLFGFSILASVLGLGILPWLIAFATSELIWFAIAAMAFVAVCALLQRSLTSSIRKRVQETEFVG
jgi:hypothetical protein